MIAGGSGDDERKPRRTERAKGWKRSLKRWLVGHFHAALVAGAPRKRHFAALGVDEAAIFTGYDAIDDGFFAGEAARVREDPEGWRKRLGLPDRYILSLGRMVGKKNLTCLIKAYADLRQRLGEHAPALVIVGSGDQEPALREQCIELGLRVADVSGVRSQESGLPAEALAKEGEAPLITDHRSPITDH